MPLSITQRMEKLRIAAGFTVTDMAQWLTVPWATAYSWCRDRQRPKEHSVPQIEERLKWLEDALKKKKVVLPIPLAVRQRARFHYVERIKTRYEQRAARG